VVPHDDGVPTADEAVVDAQLAARLASDHLGPWLDLQDLALQLSAAAHAERDLTDNRLVPGRVRTVLAVGHRHRSIPRAGWRLLMARSCHSPCYP
jgi:hypothetical protein